ncbi:MAG: RNA polymerase sigma factor [Planctomycetota bacterium]
MRKTDSELGREMQQGSEQAYTEVVERFIRPVYSVCIRCLRDPTDAQDATQDVFMRVFKGLSTFDPARPLSSWIFRIAYNRCMDYLKKRGRNLEIPIEDIEVPIEEEQPPLIGEPQDGKLRKLMWDALDDISEQNRMILLFKYRFGMKNPEIAEALGITENNLRVRLHRAKHELRTAVMRKSPEGQNL